VVEPQEPARELLEQPVAALTVPDYSLPKANQYHHILQRELRRK
jgi:hypothetical protein